MLPILNFLFIIISFLLGALVWVLIINAILSWLVAFDVVNLRNRAVAQIASMLDAISRPILAPFRRFIPTLGGIDITPVIAIVVIQAVRIALLGPLFNFLGRLVG